MESGVLPSLHLDPFAVSQLNFWPHALLSPTCSKTPAKDSLGHFLQTKKKQEARGPHIPWPNCCLGQRRSLSPACVETFHDPSVSMNNWPFQLHIWFNYSSLGKILISSPPVHWGLLGIFSSTPAVLSWHLVPGWLHQTHLSLFLQIPSQDTSFGTLEWMCLQLWTDRIVSSSSFTSASALLPCLSCFHLSNLRLFYVAFSVKYQARHRPYTNIQHW